jgi:hypothetical protein
VGKLFGSQLLLVPYGGLKTSAAFWRALISAIKNTWIYRSRPEKFDFLRLPCAYGAAAVERPIANMLIELVEREGLEPSTPAL